MKTIGTARVVKLSLMGSLLLRGHGKDFDHDPVVETLLGNPNHHPVILFPGNESLNLSSASLEEVQSRLPPQKRLVIFVIDGTWSAAKNMIRDSVQLSSLPKISFEVNAPSIYEFRKQPHAHCLSTVEAVGLLIENLRAKKLCVPKPENGHFKMVDGFKKIISNQKDFEACSVPPIR